MSEAEPCSAQASLGFAETGVLQNTNAVGVLAIVRHDLANAGRLASRVKISVYCSFTAIVVLVCI
ncbi:hypothetical protein JW868_00405 [Candidatus Woesearchaeota archaeon]|nr:hypothetical protein [Candidatus Woesearchaeota archaeon]